MKVVWLFVILFVPLTKILHYEEKIHLQYSIYPVIFHLFTDESTGKYAFS